MSAPPQAAVSLTGWGGTSPTVARLVRPRDLDELRTILAQADDRGVIVRGLGRSYGDPAQNAGGIVVDLTSWDAIIEIDAETPNVRAQAGASLDQLLLILLPLGLWMPVLPGTRHVTVGGAVCADVHGKNHHAEGSFGTHVTSLSMLLSSGDVVEATPDGELSDLFWATVGGMGLTGVVLEATIKLGRIETPHVVVDTERARDLADLLATLAARDDDYTYSVAWFDATATGDAFGRAVVTRANPARLTDLGPERHVRSGELVTRTQGRVRFRPPFSLVNRSTARAFNALTYTHSPQRRIGEVRDIAHFLHPLDTVGDWNRIYGPRGFCQYQFVVPFSEEGALTEAVRSIATSGHGSSVNVVKRFGPANPAPLSFPIPGWTIAVDLPVRAGLDMVLDHLDQIVLAAGGRVYLAKDSRTEASTIAGMYPRLDEFRAARATYDPQRRFCSDLSRRLEL